MWLLLWVSLVLADDGPVRCDAVWLQPTATCPLERVLAATGTGRDKTTAEQAAQSRLSELVTVSAELQEIQYPSRAMDGRACGAAAARHGRISCSPAMELSHTKTCFVSFSADGCIAVDALELKGLAWKTMERGRQKMCSAVERAHQTAAPVIQKKCLALCLEEALVRCP